MAKYIIDESTLQNLANAIRRVNGETKPYTPEQMIAAVTNIMNSATYILVDKYGNEYPAVYVESKTVFDATANDIRIGTTAATDEGVTVGEKEIPAYYVNAGQRFVTNGSRFVLPTPDFDYTKFQALICPFDKNLNNSVYTEKVVINDSVYDSLSTDPISTVVKDAENSGVDLGITNESGKIYLIRYFMYYV